jgi:hypothetical protein
MFPMRRLFAALLLVAAAACGSETLAPVNTVDGSWAGTGGTIQLSLGLIQDDTGAVNGNVAMAGQLGVVNGTATGTFVYPNLQLSIDIPGLESAIYSGVMSTTEARINGTLNGSGFVNQEIDLKKK